MFLLILLQETPKLPGFFSVIFSQEVISAIAAVIAGTKVFRNLLGNVKGVPAFILTIVISLAVGEFMFLQTVGWLLAAFYGLGAGLISAGVFKGAKLFGKNFVRMDLN